MQARRWLTRSGAFRVCGCLQPYFLLDSRVSTLSVRSTCGSPRSRWSRWKIRNERGDTRFAVHANCPQGRESSQVPISHQRPLRGVGVYGTDRTADHSRASTAAMWRIAGRSISPREAAPQGRSPAGVGHQQFRSTTPHTFVPPQPPSTFGSPPDPAGRCGLRTRARPAGRPASIHRRARLKPALPQGIQGMVGQVPPVPGFDVGQRSMGLRSRTAILSRQRRSGRRALGYGHPGRLAGVLPRIAMDMPLPRPYPHFIGVLVMSMEFHVTGARAAVTCGRT